jgi:hypothetical protein
MQAQIQIHNAHGISNETRSITVASVQEARGYAKRTLRSTSSRAYAYVWIEGKRICIQMHNGQWEVTER